MIFANLIHDLEDFGEVLSNLWPIYVAFAALYVGAKNLNKKLLLELTKVVDEKVAPIRIEVTPNGGGSMKDSVKRLEEGQGILGDKFNEMSYTLQRAAAIATLNQGRLQAVTANLPAAYYEMDHEGNVTSINDAYLKLYDITEQEALNSDAWRKRISPEDLMIIDSSGHQAMVSQRDWYCSFHVYRDGIQIPVVARAKALFTNGTFSGFSGAITFDASLVNKGL